MKIIRFALLLFACSVNMHAQFSGQGTGLSNDPYQIENADQLFEVRNDLSANYKLMNDIDLGVWLQEESPVQGWIPIGDYSMPFKGVIDGNGKQIKGLYINRQDRGEIGFVGVMEGGIIKNVCLVNPIVNGGDVVGTLVGRMIINDAPSSSVQDCVVIGGKIKGSNYVGGVVGCAKITSSVKGSATIYNIICNNIQADIEGDSYCGGICGACDGGLYSPKSYSERRIVISDNAFYGMLSGKVCVGGILGVLESSGYDCNWYERGDLYGGNLWSCSSICRNLSVASINGDSKVGGVVGSTEDSGESEVRYNVFAGDSIFSISGIPYRISNYDYWTNNYAYNGAVLIKGKSSMTVVDNGCNGNGLGKRTLGKRSTYEGLTYDFIKQWSIDEDESFPYNINQSARGEISEFISGSRGKISGTANGLGTVLVFVGTNIYEAAIIDGTWEVTLGNTPPGTVAKVSFVVDGKMPSLFSNAFAEKVSTSPKLKGDANGDGALDSADVTAIINYILGKPSSSFNMENADVTGDGEILIDDAVQTVQMIMDAQ